MDLTVWDFWWAFDGESFLPRRPPSEVAPALRHEVAGALRDVLRTEREASVRAAAAIALAKLADDRRGDAERLAALLADPADEVSEGAALALGILGREEDVGLLADVLADFRAGRAAVARGEVPLRTRAFAACALGLSAARTPSVAVRQRIAAELQATLRLPVQPTRDVKVAAVTAYGFCALPVTGYPGEGTDAPRTREDQLVFLLDLLDPAGAQETWGARHWFVRSHVPAALGRLVAGVPEAARAQVGEALLAGIARLTDEPVEIPMACALALGQVGDASDEGEDDIDTRIRSELLRAIEKADAQVRRFALLSLARTASRPGGGARAQAGVEPVARKLLDTLGRGKTGLKPWAGLALGTLARSLRSGQAAPGARDAADDVLAVLRERAAACRRPSEIGAYALGLALAGDERAVDVLLDRWGHFAGTPESAGAIALALSLADPERARAGLFSCAGDLDADPAGLREVALALGGVPGRAAEDALVALVSRAPDGTVRCAAAVALGRLRAVDTVEALLALLADRTLPAEARADVAGALGCIADRDEVPWRVLLATGFPYRSATRAWLDDAGTGILQRL